MAKRKMCENEHKMTICDNNLQNTVRSTCRSRSSAFGNIWPQALGKCSGTSLAAWWPLSGSSVRKLPCLIRVLTMLASLASYFPSSFSKLLGNVSPCLDDVCSAHVRRPK